MSNSKQLFVIDKNGQRGIVDVTARPPFDGSGTEILITLDSNARRVAVPIKALVDRKEQGYFLPRSFAEFSIQSDSINFENGGAIAVPAIDEAFNVLQGEAAEAAIEPTRAAQAAFDRDETLSQFRPNLKHDNNNSERRRVEGMWQDDATLEMAVPLYAADVLAASRVSQEKTAGGTSPFVRPPLVIDASAKHDKLTTVRQRLRSPLLVYASVAIALILGVLGGLLLSHSGVSNDASDSREASAQQLPINALGQSGAPANAILSSSSTDKTTVGANEPARNIEVRGRAGRWRGAYKEESPRAIELHDALNEWVAAMQSHDIDKQLSLYAPLIQKYYTSRNVSLDAVRDDKTRRPQFSDVRDVNIGEPQITFGSGGRTATMLFSLEYASGDQSNPRRDQVWYELKWSKTEEGWKIIREYEVSASRR